MRTETKRLHEVQGKWLGSASSGLDLWSKNLGSEKSLRQGDAVGAMTMSGPDRWIAPRKSGATVNLLLNGLYDLHPTAATSDYYAAAVRLGTRLKKRALVVVLTNLRDEDDDTLLPALELLRARHLVLFASLREDILTRALKTRVDSFGRGKDLEPHQQLARSEWLGNLMIAYVIRIPSGFRYITAFDLERWAIDRDELLHKLIDVQYDRNDIAFARNKFRVRGDTIEVFPAYEERAVRISMFGDDVERISVVDPLTMKVWGVDGVRVCDASAMRYVTNGNIYAPVVMLAEKAADLIAGNTPLAPEPVPFYRHGVSQPPVVAGR